jgi:hypothetical protein
MVFAFTKSPMRSRARLAASSTSEASSKRQGDGQRFQKKSYEDNKFKKRSISTGECPAIVGFKNSRLRRSHGKPGVAYADRLGLAQGPTAHPIRTG